jgi:tRNA pseudouridine13 synthase
MYVHSWQSLIWNKVASWRIRELGRDIQVGDIVRKPRSKQLSKESESESDDCGGEDGAEKCCDGGATEVEFITEANVSSSYSIDDVILPLPGWDIKLPNNKCES